MFHILYIYVICHSDLHMNRSKRVNLAGALGIVKLAYILYTDQSIIYRRYIIERCNLTWLMYYKQLSSAM